MNKSVFFVILLIFLGGVIGTLASNPAAIISSRHVKAEPYQKKVDYEGHRAEMYIDKAIINGIVSGYPDGNFKPDEPITRAGFVSIMDKVVRVPKINKDDISLTGYSDYTQIPEWANVGFQKAIYYSWLKSYSDNTIRPMSPLSLEDVLNLLPAEKLPVEFIKDKSKTFITRAEACVLIPIIQDNIFVASESTPIDKKK